MRRAHAVSSLLAITLAAATLLTAACAGSSRDSAVRVPIFVIDPRSIVAPLDEAYSEWPNYLSETRDSLRQISQGTRGFALINDLNWRELTTNRPRPPSSAP